MNLLTAPFYALFSADFYRSAIRARLGKAFLYLLLLTAAATVLFYGIVVGRLFPQGDAFRDWLKQDLPGLVWTPDGLTMDLQAPYTMSHPQLGGIITFDPTAKEIKAADLGQAMVYVTPTKLYMRQGISEVRVIDLVQAANARPAGLPQTLKIDGTMIDRVYSVMKPWMAAIGVIFFAGAFFMWKLLAALFYSWVGLLINFKRSEKLNYGAVFNVSVFAMTASILVQFLTMAFPAAARIPFGFLGALLVTCIYLWLGIIKTETAPQGGATR